MRQVTFLLWQLESLSLSLSLSGPRFHPSQTGSHVVEESLRFPAAETRPSPPLDRGTIRVFCSCFVLDFFFIFTLPHVTITRSFAFQPQTANHNFLCLEKIKQRLDVHGAALRDIQALTQKVRCKLSISQRL